LIQSDDGFFAYFCELIERVGDTRLKVYLYHFPQMSAAPISPALIARLRQRYPDTVVGLKDSSGDWAATKRLKAEFPEMAIFPSSETRLEEGLRLGMAGCISATANIQPRAIARFIDRRETPDAADWQQSHRHRSGHLGALSAGPAPRRSWPAIRERRLGDLGHITGSLLPPRAMH
jgi:4-hydroxy-tetrahydrodipicolinate synthase